MPWAQRLLRNEGIPVLPHQEHDPAVPRTAGAFLHTQSRFPPPLALSLSPRDFVRVPARITLFDNGRKGKITAAGTADLENFAPGRIRVTLAKIPPARETASSRFRGRDSEKKRKGKRELVVSSCSALSPPPSHPLSLSRYSRVITHADVLRVYYAPYNASYTVYYRGTRCHFSRCAA